MPRTHHHNSPSLTCWIARPRHTVESVVTGTRRHGIDLLPSGFDELQAVQDALFGKPGAEKLAAASPSNPSRIAGTTS